MARRGRPLSGSARLPADPLAALTALALAGLTAGATRIARLPEVAAIGDLAAALRDLGVDVTLDGDTAIVHGRGVGGLAEPARPLVLADAEPLCLLAGMLAGHPFMTILAAEPALVGAPLAPLLAPLAEYGAQAAARDGGRLPLVLTGAPHPMPIDWQLGDQAPAIATALLLAGLHAPGATTVTGAAGCDGAAALLRRFGATVTVTNAAGGRAIQIDGQPELVPATLALPGDPALAAVVLAAAAICPGSAITLAEVADDAGLDAFLETLADMGADVTRTPDAAQPAADLTLVAAPLRGTAPPAERLARMAASLPALAVVAACADGPTRLGRGSPPALADALGACGVAIAREADGLVIDGSGRPPAGGGALAGGDPALSLALLALGTVTSQPVRVDASLVERRAPGFPALLGRLGARLGRAA